jgi:signal transduction histidine kinase
MASRGPLRLPIILAIVMIVLLLVLTVGWVLLSVFGAMTDERSAVVYWALLPIGSTFIALLLGGVVVYLVLSIKAINLTRRQSNFIDSVTHELKSPLASLKLYLQTLSRHHVPEEQQAEFHRFMLDDLERLDRLINQMLAAGRVESGSGAGQAEDVDLGELLEQCAAAVCVSYRVPRETVALDCEPCVVRARPLDLDLIFRNIIDNAVKYAGNPPAVQVTLRRGAAGTARTRISDNGQGIPRHLRRKIFGRFVRAGSELERERPGTGLGLYIVRTVVKRLRGQVAIRDGVHATGTTFEVILPALKKADGKSDG